MALIDCPECGKSISSLADECPRCGYPGPGDSYYSSSDATTASPPESETSEKKGTGGWLAVLGVVAVMVALYLVTHPEATASPERLVQSIVGVVLGLAVLPVLLLVFLK